MKKILKTIVFFLLFAIGCACFPVTQDQISAIEVQMEKYKKNYSTIFLPNHFLNCKDLSQDDFIVLEDYLLERKSVGSFIADMIFKKLPSKEEQLDFFSNNKRLGCHLIGLADHMDRTMQTYALSLLISLGEYDMVREMINRIYSTGEKVDFILVRNMARAIDVNYPCMEDKTSPKHHRWCKSVRRAQNIIDVKEILKNKF